MSAPLRERRSLSKEIAVCAVMTALLIGGQLAFSAVVGIEIVTVLLLTFSWSFGARRGVWTAVAFSLLRCLLWGFHPPAIALYLLYYPAFALLFGSLGSARRAGGLSLPGLFAADILLSAVAAGCAFCAATDFLKISMLEIGAIRVMLWAIFGCCCALLFLLNGAHILLALRGQNARVRTLATVAAVTALAAVCTVCFTLLDDVITPLYYGLEWGSAAFMTYFYGSFLALVPQTLCTIATVSLLFVPFTKTFDRIARRPA